MILLLYGLKPVDKCENVKMWKCGNGEYENDRPVIFTFPHFHISKFLEFLPY